MNTFFFGTSDRRLYGVFHPTQNPKPDGSSPGAVLCYPSGAEYMRSHRAFRQLTTLLNRQGVSVFRFDYFGTGDSGGWGEDGSVEGWSGDVHTACQELKDTAGLSSVSLIGLRLGASLASLAASTRDDVDRLILWDPIVSGSAYLEDMFAKQEAILTSGGGVYGAVQDLRAQEVVGVSGFPLTKALRRELSALTLTDLEITPATQVDIVASEAQAMYSHLAEAWIKTGANASLTVIPSQGNWDEDDKFGSALIPQAIIQGVVERMKIHA